MDRHWLESTQPGPGGETYPTCFPDALIAALAGLNDLSVPRIAAEWGKAEEINAGGAATTPVLNQPRQLARSARATAKSMYLWGSL
jgi:hypothetical protein